MIQQMLSLHDLGVNVKQRITDAFPGPMSL
jgi:hypothetical protein